MKDKLLISFSGGRTSAYMTHVLINNYADKYDFIVVFANTGKERNETLDFVHKCDTYWKLNCVWVEAEIYNTRGQGTRHKVVNYHTASRNGEPFEAMIQKYGIPNVAFPHCTRELKAQAIRSYARSVWGNDYYTAIGIRVDEIDRVAPDAKEKRYIYPLVSYNGGITKKHIEQFWKDMPFDLRIKQHEGNCDLCFKKSYRKLMMILKTSPECADWWQKMENKYGNFVPETHNQIVNLPIRFFRNNKSISDIFEMIRLDEKQLRLFEDLDISNGCTESCEVF